MHKFNRNNYKKKILYYFTVILLVTSCGLSKEEQISQQDIINSCKVVNEMLPFSIDEYTIVKKVGYDIAERTYTNFYTIDWSSLSKNELEDIFASIKLEQIAHARNSVDTKHFKILRIKLRYEYRDDKNNLIHAFEISPEDYIDEPT